MRDGVGAAWPTHARHLAAGPVLARPIPTISTGSSQRPRKAPVLPGPGPDLCGHHVGVAFLDLYHRTDAESAELVYRQRSMISRENTAETYWSNRVDGQATGYGQAVVHIRVPEQVADSRTSSRNGEQHFRLHVTDLRPEHFVMPERTVETDNRPTPERDIGPGIGL